LQLLSFGALAYILLLLSGIFPAEMRATNLDIDWFYRKPATAFLRFCEGPLTNFRLGIQKLSSGLVGFAVKFGADPVFIPELIIRHLNVQFAQFIASISKSKRSRARLEEMKFKLSRLQKIAESGRIHVADLPKKPIGLGVLFSFIFIFIYVLIYILY
jgi:hypothetical protein